MQDLLGLRPEESHHLATLRCDVERDLEHHLHFARQAEKAGIPCTFYFHSRTECYSPVVFDKIRQMGHEVGFHHECLDRCRGNFEAAKALFEKEVNRFKTDGFFPVTVCAHGESGLHKVGYRFNYELFSRYPELLSQCGVAAEVYTDIIPQWKPHYVSDVFSAYRHFWDRLSDGKQKPELLHVLIHPHRWHTSPAVSSWEIGKDLAQAMQNKIFKYRSYQTIGV